MTKGYCQVCYTQCKGDDTICDRCVSIAKEVYNAKEGWMKEQFKALDFDIDDVIDRINTKVDELEELKGTLHVVLKKYEEKYLHNNRVMREWSYKATENEWLQKTVDRLKERIEELEHEAIVNNSFPDGSMK